MNWILWFWCPFGKEVTETHHHHKVMDPMDGPFPISLWEEGRSPVYQQCCTSGSSTHPPLAENYCQLLLQMGAASQSWQKLNYFYFSYKPLFSLFYHPLASFHWTDMISEFFWVFFDKNQISEPLHLPSCTEDEEMMGTWSSCVQSSRLPALTFGEDKMTLKKV